MTRATDLERFTAAYIECALWSSTRDDDDDNMSDMEDAIAPETRERMAADCAKFVAAQREVLDTCDESGDLPLRGDDARECGFADAYAMAGHDFWLTRNRHGAGFWDGDWEIRVPGLRVMMAADVLTDAAHAFGEYDLYIGDDGQIWGTP